MEFSDDGRAFLVLMLAGGFLGVMFDACRLVRNIYKVKNFGTAFLDIGYWALAVALVFAVLVNLNQSELRFYVFFALILGAAGYFYFLSRHVLLYLMRTTRFLQKCIVIIRNGLRSFFITIILKPFRFILQSIAAPFALAARLLKNLLRRIMPLPPTKPPI